MSNNAINVRQRFIDSSGNSRANGYVYFYENGTTTLASIYSDELLSIPQSNPYRLNANGEIEGDVKYSGKMTVKVTNSDGSDPITDDDVESQGGSASDLYVDQFKVVENSPANMAVVIRAGKTMNGETLVSVANQTTTLIVAPVSNPRIDRVVINKLTGIYSIVTGSEAAIPTAPAITVGYMPAAQIALQTSTTTITDALITDERISGSIEPSNANTTETFTNKTIGDTNTINAQDDAFTIDDAADATLQIDFNVAGTTGTKTTITSSQTANRIMTIPDATDTFVARNTTDTLTNKTLGDTNTINAQDDAFAIQDAADNTIQIGFNAAGTTGTTTTITSSQTTNKTLTLPDATDTIVARNTTDTLTNKTIGDTNTINAQDDAFAVQDAADPTIQVLIDAAGTTGTTTTLTSSQTVSRNLTLPDATDTLVGRATADTLTNKTIGDTNTINAQDDAFTINDSVDPTIQIDFNAAGTTGTKTTITSSQTTNKVVTIPDATDTLVGKATTDTLTNKSIDLTNNTLTGTTAQFNTALSDNDFATLAGTETLSNKTFSDSPTISNTSPSLIVKDSDSTGVSQTGKCSFTDSSDTEVGAVGFQSTADKDLDIENKHSGGNINFIPGPGGKLKAETLAIANIEKRTLPKSTPLYGVVCNTNGPTWVAVGGPDGADAFIVYSGDGGENWTEASNPKNYPLYDIVYNGSIYCAVGGPDGTDTYIVTASSPSSWTEQSNPTLSTLHSVTWNGTVLCAVGNDIGAYAYIITSTNGTSWSGQSNPINGNLYGVTAHGTVLVAVGQTDATDAAIITSTDNGANWTERSNAKAVDLNAVASDGSTIVAVGNYDGADSYIVTSTDDGVTWVERSNPGSTTLNNVYHTGEMFVSVGQAGQIIVSRDGLSWTKVPVYLSAGFEAVAHDGNRFMLVSDVGLHRSLNIF